MNIALANLLKIRFEIWHIYIPSCESVVVTLAFVVYCSSYTTEAAVQETGYMQYKYGLDEGDEFDEHHMKTAKIVARESPDQNTKVRINLIL